MRKPRRWQASPPSMTSSSPTGCPRAASRSSTASWTTPGKTYKAAHYDHGNGLAIADVDGDGRTDIYFVNQVGGNQLWRNAGGGRFEDITASAGVAVPGKVSVSAVVRRHRQRRRRRPLRHDRARRQRAVRERRQGPLPRHHRRRRPDLRRPLVGGGVLRLRPRRPARSLPRQRRPVHDGDTRSPATAYKYYVAFEDAFSGHLKPERAERSILYRNEGGNRFVDVSKRTGLVDLSWTGDASAGRRQRRWLARPLRDQHAGRRPVLRERRRHSASSGRAAQVFPRTSWGSMGIKVFDFNNDGRLDIFVTDMHSDMSQPTRPGARQAEVGR